MTAGRAVGIGRLGAAAAAGFGWRLAVVLAPPLLLAGVLGVGQARAQLPSNCSRSGNTVSCQFSSTGAEQSFSVPAGARSVRIEAVGAPGGAGANGAPGGGAGAVARGTPSVTVKSPEKPTSTYTTSADLT